MARVAPAAEARVSGEADALRMSLTMLASWDFREAVAAVRGTADEALVRAVAVQMANTMNRVTTLEDICSEEGLDLGLP